MSLADHSAKNGHLINADCTAQGARLGNRINTVTPTVNGLRK
jgi:hypothetical protein